MKRLFALDLSMRSTACKYDPCIISDEKRRPKLICKDCKVTFISDRFLGEDFHRRVLAKALARSFQKYTYTIIADAVGCDLNCWFCYAWKFLKKSLAEKECRTSFLSSEELAKQFFCKLRKVSSMQYMVEQIRLKAYLGENERRKIIGHIKLNLPLTRIRISGGEPIFSNEEVLIEYDDEEPIHLAGVRYWLTFFKELDELVGKLKGERVVHFVAMDEWDKSSPYLSCLCEVPRRLSVRFDTNGILFGSENITESFIGGLFKPHNEDKLSNLFVQIDYSFKGASPTEYFWSQGTSLPVSLEKNKLSFVAEEHPQYRGYKNIVNIIEKYVNIDGEFCDCVSIIAERGIDHDKKQRVYLYYPEALDWGNFSKITGIELSPVINCFDPNFGWRPEAKIRRYSARDALIKMITERSSIDNMQASIQELIDFRNLHKDDPSFKVLVFPYREAVEAEEKWRGNEKEPLQTFPMPSFGWVLSGNPENWVVALRNKKWGVSPHLKFLWERVKEGDPLFFYATRPVSGLIGMARARSKMEEKSLLWPDEVHENRIKYPFRIEFEIVSIINEADWRAKRLPIRYPNLIRHGINVVRYKRIVDELAGMLRDFMESA